MGVADLTETEMEGQEAPQIILEKEGQEAPLIILEVGVEYPPKDTGPPMGVRRMVARARPGMEAPVDVDAAGWPIKIEDTTWNSEEWPSKRKWSLDKTNGRNERPGRRISGPRVTGKGTRSNACSMN